MLQVLQRQAVGAEALLELLLGVVQRVLTVHEPDEEVLLLLEAVVAQADRVLDDVVGAALVLLRGDVQVGTHPQAHVLASFQVTRGGFFHRVPY